MAWLNRLDDRWHVLEPFFPEEAMTSASAAKRAGVTQRTILNWCEGQGLGRIIGGRWRISRVALEMFLAGDGSTLSKYLGGDRADDRVVDYFKRVSVPLPQSVRSNRGAP